MGFKCGARACHIAADLLFVAVAIRPDPEGSVLIVSRVVPIAPSVPNEVLAVTALHRRLRLRLC